MSFQSESKLSGDKFENNVYNYLIINGFQNIKKNVYVADAGIEVDFVSGNDYIEAKGGLEGYGKRPGARRTDNVKKAIANGALLKSVMPNAIYTVYFSSKPIPQTSSDIMIKTALSKNFIDNVVYLEDNIDLFETLFGTLEWEEK
jgi:hypothetical protein